MTKDQSQPERVGFVKSPKIIPSGVFSMPAQEREVAAHFQAVSGVYDRLASPIFPIPRIMADYTIRALGKYARGGKKLHGLDIGCGTGLVGRSMLGRASAVALDGLDLSRAMMVNMPTESACVYTQLMAGRLEDLSCAESMCARYDFAVSSGMYEFIPTERLTAHFRAVATVLKSGADFLFTTQAFEKIDGQRDAGPKVDRSVALFQPSRAEIRGALSEAGFNPDKVKRYATIRAYEQTGKIPRRADEPQTEPLSQRREVFYHIWHAVRR